MENSKITQLTEMGFTMDQAEEALRITNGQVEDAINYLFGEPIEQPPPQPEKNRDQQSIEYQNTVQIKNPQDIPHFDSLISDAPEKSNEGWEYEHIEEKPQSSIFDNPSMYHRETAPIVLPKLRYSSQSYLIPLISILCQVKEIRGGIYSKHYDHYEFDPTWFTHKINENTSSMKELQKIVSFLTTDLSSRSFISGEPWLDTISPDLIDQENDAWEEILTKFFPWFINTVKSISNVDLFDKFHSTVVSENGQNAVMNNIMIEFENRSNTISESLNKLFWENPDVIYLTYLSPIVIFQINGEDYDFVQPIQLEETIYPQVFSKAFLEVITQMNQKKNESNQERSKLTNKIMNLSSFEGKRIKNILSTTISHFKHGEAADDLRKLLENITNETTYLNSRVNDLNNDNLKYDIRNHENVLKFAREKGLEQPEEYRIRGVIISDSDFVYRSKLVSQDWVYCTLKGTDQVLDYDIELLDFKSVQNLIHDLSKDSQKSFIVIYAIDDESVNEEVIPEKLKEFWAKDNELVKQQLEQAKQNSESSSDVINEATNEVDDEDVDLIEIDDT